MLAPGHGAKQLEKLCSHQLPSCFGLIFSIYGPEFGLRPLFCAELRQMFLPVFLRPVLTGTIHRPYVWWDLSQHVQHFWLFTCCMSNCFILEPWGQGPVQNKVVQVRTEYMHVVSNRASRYSNSAPFHLQCCSPMPGLGHSRSCHWGLCIIQEKRLRAAIPHLCKDTALSFSPALFLFRSAGCCI